MSSSKGKGIQKIWEKLVGKRDEIDKETNDLKESGSSTKEKYEKTSELWKKMDKADKLEDKLEKKGVPKRFI